MKTNIDISFIIPIFNNSLFELKNCIKSISKLEKEINYEILLIDDGSNKDLQEGYKKVSKKNGMQYFYEANQGVSSARNLGIKKSKGQYIFFVDADDEICANNIKKRDFAEQKDFIIYGVERIIINTKKRKKFFLNCNEDIKSLNLQLLSDGTLNWVFAKLYLREFLIKNKIQFDSNVIIGEDWDFVKQMLVAKPTISIYKKIGYLYLNDPETEYKRNINKPKNSMKDAWLIYKKRIELLNKLELKDKTNYKNKNLDVKLAIIISIFGALGAIIGAEISVNIEVEKLKKLFGIFLAIITMHEIYTLFKEYKQRKIRHTKNS